MFDTFTQADRSLDRARGGLGLGLALAKGWVEKQGGEITVESAGLGRGTRFMFTLPLAPQDEEATSASTPPTSAPQGRRILIIEDNPDTAHMLKDLLDLFGHDVRVALEGAEGLKQFESGDPEVVLCDIGLPGMDGFEVARKIRQREKGKTYLVAVTGYGQEEMRRSAEEAGFDSFLIKPAAPEMLQQHISNAPPLSV